MPLLLLNRHMTTMGSSQDVVKAFQQVVKTIVELDTSLDEIRVRTIPLLPGMRLARDLVTSEGVVSPANGATLLEATITSLINLQPNGQPHTDCNSARNTMAPNISTDKKPNTKSAAE